MCEYLLVMAYAPWIRFQAARLLGQLHRPILKNVYRGSAS